LEKTVPAFTKARFIKLGEKGEWERLCLEDGTLRLGYYEVPHDAALASDREAIKKTYKNQGVTTGAASNHARQVLDFYDHDPELIWITFSSGYLWWYQAKAGVEFLGQDRAKFPQGSRLRHTVSGWSNTSLTGQELRQTELSGRLTKVKGFKGTICDIKDETLNYLIAKITGQDQPYVTAAKSALSNLEDKAEDLIRHLTWQDFELFVELLFSRSGYVRTSTLGGTVSDIDLELLQPITGERAVVQIKSQTTQQQLDEYVMRLEAWPADKIFYVYHTAHPLLATHPKLQLMNIQTLARTAVTSGLVSWLIKKI
jgi:hypothetical protein